MPLAPGIRLGAYEVVALLGSGGMGEVYRARDPRLGRDVAIKVLPAAFTADPDRLARFDQEARAAAALNHPNILAVYDLGTYQASPYIVSELLEGGTLRTRLQGTALPVRKAVDYAVQMARGLAAAHEKGIVHRDLKPENLFVTGDGRIKILDFGLAKLTQGETVAAGVSAVSTQHQPDTVPGMVLGTLGYMSPEQVRGLDADHRSDIFALGAVLYEMLSGRRAFRGDTTADTMTAILREDPPDIPSDLRMPPALGRIVDRCLEKNPSARFQSTGDLAFALEAMSSQASAPDAIAPVPRMAGGSRLAWMFATVLTVALAAIAAVAALLYSRRGPIDAPVYRSSINVPPEARAAAFPPSGLALSPDGRRLVFSALSPDGHRLLWIRPIDGTTAQPLPGTDDGGFPFWSPDSRFVAFMAGGQLKKIDVLGGPPVTVCDAPGGLNGTWGANEVILFFAISSGKQVIWRVSSAGGTPTPATTLDESAGDNRHTAPFFLPDGQHFLYLALGSKTGGANDPRAVYIGSLDPAESAKLLLQGGSNAKYGSGHLLFLRGQTLMAQPFDATRLELKGEAAPVAQDLTTGGQAGQIGAFSVSDNGVLAYLAAAPVDTSQLAWFDRAGKQIGVLGDPADYGDIALAPDATRAAVTVLDSARRTRDIWLYDVRRNLRTRFTFDPANEYEPVWSPDGSRIVFNSTRKGFITDLYDKPSSGAASEAILFADSSPKIASSWSHDGRLILYSTGTPRTADGRADIATAFDVTNLWFLPLTGDRKPSPFVLQTSFASYTGRFSPDSRWVAYVSDESGRPEVYVAPFPGAGGKWQISRTGGSWPQWRRDGKEIFYLAPNNMLMVAAVNGQGTAFEVGTLTPLFQTRARPLQRSPYDVSVDGQRFLVNSLVGEPTTAPLTLVVNWPALLRKEQ